MGNVLVIDDQADICESIAAIATRMGHRVSCAHTRSSGLEAATAGAFDLVLLDVRLPDGSGLDILPNLKEIAPSPEVVILTGYGDPAGAEAAIRNGAWDYLEKPSTTRQIRHVLEVALEYQYEKSRREVVPCERCGIVGHSAPLMDSLEQMANAAGCDADVLITGETGTGKEMFALAIHKNSRRESKSFVVVDCAALPRELVESMLFGHERGAYTGADRSQEGLVQQADGGTLFLDEVGELPLSVQKKFLRVLQERCFRPVGGKREISSNFRLVAATNQDLDSLVDKGLFREDLLFRLRAINIVLPCLRERRSDVEELAKNHVRKICEQYKTPAKSFSSDFFLGLSGYDWPGNVRELYQALEKAIVSAGASPMLFPKDLPTHIRAKIARNKVRSSEPPPPYQPAGFDTAPESLSRSLCEKSEEKEACGEVISAQFPSIHAMRDAVLADAERRYLSGILDQTRGNVVKACTLAGLSRSRFYALLKKYGISA